MSSLLTQSPLAANLAGLGDRNADVRRAIESSPASPEVVFDAAPTGLVTAQLAGARLASARDPRAEAERLIDTVDLVDHTAFVVFGFGLGHHVQVLAERLRGNGLIIVYEPDVALLRAVFERIDHSAWIRDALLLFVTDPDDHVALTRKLAGAEAILGQGVEMTMHPASRKRLGPGAAAFSSVFTEAVSVARITLMTTLVRAADTVENLIGNIDHYVGGPGVTELAGAARGRLGVVVSAGPSLHRNLPALAAPGVRDRCVIIAVQTTLKPLLDAGVRPHFVTALDYHEISRRFYEGLDARDVDGVTLVADPKAHPAILDAFPGTVRCCASSILDELLRDARPDNGVLPAGATVAHLAVYLARHLGCDPIALVGQDLGFTDGLYYAPGTAIEEVWGPEINPFNTLDTMQRQRIARHRTHLRPTVDVHGRAMLTDDQMLAYRQHFERDFAEFADVGITIVDATEGGVVKKHTVARPLAETLDTHADTPLPALPTADRAPDAVRLDDAAVAIDRVRSEVTALRQLSRRTQKVLTRMLVDQSDARRMDAHFKELERLRARVHDHPEAFRQVNHLNQVGVFKRKKADRRLQMLGDLAPLERQQAQIERDIVNVEWMGDAAAALEQMLEDGAARLRGDTVALRRGDRGGLISIGQAGPPRRVSALVPVDPDRSGLGIERSLLEPFGSCTVLQATLERLGRVESLESIILLLPHGSDLDTTLDRSRIDRPLIIERTDGSPFGAERAAIAAARCWADTSWRGGIAGMSVYDEVLCPAIMHAAMMKHRVDAALLVAPDWPLLDPSAESGCEAVVRRFLEHPDHLRMTMTQAPPGLCGCVVSATLMRSFGERSRLATMGAQLVYQPHVPQSDPIGKDTTVRIEPEIRRPRIRATFDSARQRDHLRSAFSQTDPHLMSPAEIAAALAETEKNAVDRLPRHVVLELTPRSSHDGAYAPPTADRPDLDPAVAERILSAMTASGDALLTLAGFGDPLMHPQCASIIHAARAAGVRGIHVRTALLAATEVLDALLAAEPDVISVELPADSAETYARMMGTDRYLDVVANIQHLLRGRRHLAGPEGTTGLALPWIVPRFPRREETYAELESYYDRWQHLLGTPVIEDAGDGGDNDPLITLPPLTEVVAHEARRRMTILSDGSVPIHEDDPHGSTSIGNAAETALTELWAQLQVARRGAVEPMRLRHP